MERMEGKVMPRIFRAGISSEGFTLIEVAIVVVIMGIFFSLSLPRLMGVLEEEELKGAARSLGAYIQYIYDQSVLQKEEIFLHISLDKDEYWAEVVKGGESSSLGEKKRLPQGITFEDVISPLRGKIREGEISFLFSPLGMSERGIVHLEDERGKVFSLLLYLTGEFAIYNRYVEEEEVEGY